MLVPLDSESLTVQSYQAALKRITQKIWNKNLVWAQLGNLVAFGPFTARLQFNNCPLFLLPGLIILGTTQKLITLKSQLIFLEIVTPKYHQEENLSGALSAFCIIRSQEASSV